LRVGILGRVFRSLLEQQDRPGAIASIE
jgi:hypothetical protein